jgi:hypothetical protein
LQDSEEDQFMRRPHLCALLSVVSIAALQTLPAAAASPGGDRQLSQEHWMVRQGVAGARTSPRPEVRVHFFNPNQVIRVSQRTGAPPLLRPAIMISRPAPAAPARPLIIAANRTAPRLMASHPVVRIGGIGGTRPQPEIRSGR